MSLQIAYRILKIGQKTMFYINEEMILMTLSLNPYHGHKSRHDHYGLVQAATFIEPTRYSCPLRCAIHTEVILANHTILPKIIVHAPCILVMFYLGI